MIDAFVHAATNGRRTRAEALLAGRPEIARDPWAALVLGRDWPGDPKLGFEPEEAAGSGERSPMLSSPWVGNCLPPSSTSGTSHVIQYSWRVDNSLRSSSCPTGLVWNELAPSR